MVAQGTSGDPESRPVCTRACWELRDSSRRFRVDDEQTGSYRFVRRISTVKRACVYQTDQLPDDQKPSRNGVLESTERIVGYSEN